MTMKVATVEILIEKARFEPRVAVAVAEAMDEAIDGKNRDAQWVTVPILDARFTALEAKFDAKFAALEAKFDAKLAALEAKFDAKLAAFKASLLTHLYGAILSQSAVLLALAYFFVSHLK